MPSMPPAVDTATAFDALAATYDRDFSASLIAQFLRKTVHRQLDRLILPGDQVLELGCGTGIDAAHLAERGAEVLATDSSQAMLKMAASRLAASPNVSLAPLDLQHLPVGDPRLETQFDLVFANFGVVNCVHKLTLLAEWLAERIKPGGWATFAIMSRYCLWEASWHGLHGEYRIASRRWRSGSLIYQSDTGITMVHYPSVGQMRRAFSGRFVMRKVMPLGFFLPPSDIFGVVEKRRRLRRILTQMEQYFQFMPILANFSDHYWIEFQRVETAT